MRLKKTKRSHSVVFNLTPLIDIVFLLIIFFMTVSQVTRIVDQPMPLPMVSQGTRDGPVSTMTINLDQRGDIFIAGREFSQPQTITMVQERKKKRESINRRLEIEMRCDRRCPSEHVNQLMEELSRVGVNQVRIAVAEETEG